MMVEYETLELDLLMGILSYALILFNIHVLFFSKDKDRVIYKKFDK